MGFNKSMEAFENLIMLKKEKHKILKSEVEYIINNSVKNEVKIQNTLDELFDLCEEDDGLLLYRRLCRYYYDINSVVAIEYIKFYKEEYDPQGLKFGKTDSKEVEWVEENNMLGENLKELIAIVKQDILKTRYEVQENANIQLMNLYFRIGKNLREKW